MTRSYLCKLRADLLASRNADTVLGSERQTTHGRRHKRDIIKEAMSPSNRRTWRCDSRSIPLVTKSSLRHTETEEEQRIAASVALLEIKQENSKLMERLLQVRTRSETLEQDKANLNMALLRRLTEGKELRHCTVAHTHTSHMPYK